MSRWIKLSVIAATATLTVLPLVAPAADAQTIYVNPQPYSQQAQQPPRGGAWGDRDRDGIPNAFDQYNNNRRRGMGDQDHDGIPNRYDRDRNRGYNAHEFDRLLPAQNGKKHHDRHNRNVLKDKNGESS